MDQISKASLSRSLYAIGFLSFCTWGGYITWIMMSGQAHRFDAQLLQTYGRFLPHAFTTTVAAGGLSGLIYATAVRGIVTTIYLSAATATIVGAYFVFRIFSPKQTSGAVKKTTPTPTTNKNFLVANPPEIETIIDFKGESYVFKPQAAEVQMRLDRAKLKFKNQPTTPYQKLQAALLEILYAHKDTPADPVGHHAATSLLDHSRSVSKQMSEAAKNDPLAGVIGLCHDIGKVVAYRKKYDGKGHSKWEIRSKRHDQLSAQIVSLLPEFNLLPLNEQTTLLTVLRFTHNFFMLPKRRTSDREVGLIKLLQKIDGLTTQSEKATVEDIIFDQKSMDEIQTAMTRLIPTLNVNGTLTESGYMDGFTGVAYEFVAIQSKVVLEKLVGHLSNDLTTNMSLRVTYRRQLHPALPLIIEALRRLGYLIEDYKGISPSNGLFSVKSGIKTMHRMVLLDRNKLEEAMPSAIATWGEKAPYPLKVVEGGSLNTPMPTDDSQNDNEDQASN